MLRTSDVSTSNLLVGFRLKPTLSDSSTTKSSQSSAVKPRMKLLPSPPSWKAQKLVGIDSPDTFKFPPASPLQNSPYFKQSVPAISVAASSNGFSQGVKQFRIGASPKDLSTLSLSRSRESNIFETYKKKNPYKSYNHHSKTSLHSGTYGSIESLAQLSISSRELPKFELPQPAPFMDLEARAVLKTTSQVFPATKEFSPQRTSNLNFQFERTYLGNHQVGNPNAYQIQWFANNFIPLSSQLCFGKVIGEGTFAKVYEGWDVSLADRPLVAVKLFQKRLFMQSGNRKSLQGEVDHLSKLKHPNVVQLKRVVEDQKFVCLVCQFCGQQTLKDELSANGWSARTISLFRDLANALDYMHRQNVYHRDLKLTNVMVHEGSAILIDLGMATTSTSKEYLYCGTACYLSPEMVSRQGYFAGPNDVWAFGTMLFKAFCGYFPFGGRYHPNPDSKNPKETEQSIIRCKYPRNAIQGQPQLTDLLDRIFVADAARRPCMSQILKHSLWKQAESPQRGALSPLKIVREVDSRSEALRVQSPTR